MTTDAFKKAENRILARNVKRKFTNPVEDIANVRVLSSGVVSVAGQVYKSETGGFRPGSVIEAVNIQTKGNAHYRSRFGSESGRGKNGEELVTLNELRKLVADMMDDWNLRNPGDPAPTDETPVDTAPTLDDIIRGSAGPFGPFPGVGGIDSEATTSFTFTIPDWVVEGDLMLMYIANLTDHTEAYVISEASFGWGVSGTGGSHTDWIDYDSNSSTTDEVSSTPVQKVGIEYLFRVAEAGEAGTDYTFTFGGTPTTYYYYLLVINGTYISDIDEISSGNNDIDGFSEAGQANFYVESLTVAGDTTLLIIAGAIQGNVRTTPPSNYRELADVGNSDVSMYLMVRLANTGATGIINAYLDDAAAFFASLGSATFPAA